MHCLGGEQPPTSESKRLNSRRCERRAAALHLGLLMRVCDAVRQEYVASDLGPDIGSDRCALIGQGSRLGRFYSGVIRLYANSM